MENYTVLLHEHHLKATPQRLEIAYALDIYGHINIEKLYTILLQKFKTISLATIYKNINLMLDASFIQEVKIPDAKSVYELTKETHSHAICTQCSHIEDLSLNLNNIKENASSATQFQIKKADLIFSGLCKNCQ